jgi:hypothetical protein
MRIDPTGAFHRSKLMHARLTGCFILAILQLARSISPAKQRLLSSFSLAIQTTIE